MFLNSHDHEYSEFFERVERLRRGTSSQGRNDISTKQSAAGQEPASTNASKFQGRGFWQDIQTSLTPLNNQRESILSSRSRASREDAQNARGAVKSPIGIGKAMLSS